MCVCVCIYIYYIEAEKYIARDICPCPNTYPMLINQSINHLLCRLASFCRRGTAIICFISLERSSSYSVSITFPTLGASRSSPSGQPV